MYSEVHISETPGATVFFGTAVRNVPVRKTRPRSDQDGPRPGQRRLKKVMDDTKIVDGV